MILADRKNTLTWCEYEKEKEFSDEENRVIEEEKKTADVYSRPKNWHLSKLKLKK